MSHDCTPSRLNPPQEPNHLQFPTEEVHGTVLLGFVQACLNLHLIAPRELEELAGDIDPLGWYPLDRLCQFERVVEAHFQDASVIFEQAGIAFAGVYFHSGGGNELVRRGVDFLRLQNDSAGYLRVVRGREEQVGRFALVQLDAAAGSAIIESSTPFSRDFERGLIMGGMLAPGDLWYVKVNHDADPHRFVITFRPTVSLADRAHRGEVPDPDEWNPRLRIDPDWVDPLYWRYQGLLEEQRRNHRFWEATNRTLERLAQQLHDLSRRMEDLAHQDPLTALTNRRGIIKLLEQEYARSVRYDAPLSVGILDLDWFKKINDTHGHLAGDEVLRSIAKILAETLRLSDSIGRLSGEEFLLIFPGTTAIEAAQAANKLREKVAQIDFPCENGCFRVTASFGVADRTADTEHMTELMRRADYALYKAKKAGRNRVERCS